MTSVRSAANFGSRSANGQPLSAVNWSSVSVTDSVATKNGMSRIDLPVILVVASRNADSWTRGSVTWSRAALRASPLSMSAVVGLSRIRVSIAALVPESRAWRRASRARSRRFAWSWDWNQYWFQRIVVSALIERAWAVFTL